MALDSVAPRPWLKRGDWSAREIRCGKSVGAPILLLTYAFLGGLFLVIWSTGEHRFVAAVVGLALLSCLGVLTRLWLRHARYGDSVCRLITLPGVIGGWFKADVECRLPSDPSEPVLIQLINSVGQRSHAEIWRMEERLASAPIPVDSAGCSIVRVRLRIPRSRGQLPMPLEGGGVQWRLNVRKKSPSVDFLAHFYVPIYDVADAPASEQLPE